jgi:hypothetical protein
MGIEALELTEKYGEVFDIEWGSKPLYKLIVIVLEWGGRGDRCYFGLVTTRFGPTRPVRCNNKPSITVARNNPLYSRVSGDNLC